MRIFIDPGHGGADPGAVSPRTGMKEAEVNLRIAARLHDILAGLGHAVNMSRFSDSTVSLSARCDMERAFGADVFISIHCDSFSLVTAEGNTVYTMPGQGKADVIASKINQELKAEFSKELVFREDWSDGDADKEANFQVLRDTNAPAILIECAFISNQKDEAFLVRQDTPERFAKAIVKGLGLWVEPAQDKIEETDKQKALRLITELQKIVESWG